MKKKSRRPRSTETVPQSGKTQQSTVSVSEEKGPALNPGRRWKSGAGKDLTAAEDTQAHPEGQARPSGRLSTAVCRLCHGKFSPRSLRHAFNKWPQDSIHLVEEEEDSLAPSTLLFHTDFQRLVGVQLDRDPRLSDFICKKCHANFYKCHGILIRFLQRVNLPPLGKENLKSRKNAKCSDSSVNHSSTRPPSFTSDPKCLHSLVTWAHHHGEACRSCPDLREVLKGQCWGSAQAVWGCVDGHKYIMNTATTNPGYTMALGSGVGEAVMSEEEEEPEPEEDDEGEQARTPVGNRSTLAQHSPAAVTHTDSSVLADWTNADGHEQADRLEDRTEQADRLEDRTADSDLSDRVIFQDAFEESRKEGFTDDVMFEPCPDKRARRVSAPNKRKASAKAPKEPKVRKKPGPKPGWKNKLKPKGEELPNIYKCPYQGCTAVYRAPDALKKHIKEHHEEVKERPCPHPGCNKVFMIDRYLQRHVKLIHTEQRNFICDQCGQTFKQRKHLSVHQMRHSGAKPLQCEVCGFQCRQRASLKYHMTKHKAEADLEFACLLCRKRFEKAHNLNVHMSMVHPLTQAEVAGGGSRQSQQQGQPTLYSELHTITLTGEVVQQDHHR